jgi:hypothetical protein
MYYKLFKQVLTLSSVITMACRQLPAQSIQGLTASEAAPAIATAMTAAAADGAGAPGAFNLKTTPNPVRSSFVLTMPATTERTDNICFYGVTGRLLQRKRISCQSGINYIEWDMGHYAAGIHYIRLQSKYTDQ